MNKLCCTCKQEKPVEEFGRLAASNDGLAIRCKECFRRLNKESAQRNPEARKSSKRKYYESHKEEIAAKSIINHKRYVEQNREKVLAKKRAYRLANMAKVREGQKRWEQANPEKRRAYYDAALARDPARIHANWKRNYKPEQAKAIAKRWKKENPDKVRACSAEYDSRKRVAKTPWANTFFIGEIYKLAQLRTKMTGVKWVVDHIVPVRHRNVCGLHVEQNLRVIPEKVNYAKSNKLLPNVMEVMPCHF